MPIFSNQTSKEQHHLWAILSPSFLSVLLSFLVVLAVVGGTIVATAYTTSIAPSFMATLNQASKNGAVAPTYQSATNFLNGKTAFSDAPLALFWAFVGVGVYAIVISLGSVIKSAAETERTTKYKHVDHDAFVRTTLIRLFVRLLGIALTWIVASVLIKYLFPYCIAAAHVASQGGWGQHFIYAVAAAFGIMVGLHLLVVTVRIVMLRVRLFS